MFGVKEVIDAKFQADERLRSVPRDPVPWWGLEVFALIGLTVLILMVLS